MTRWMIDGAGAKFKASVGEFLFDRGFFLSTNHKMIHASSRHPVGNSRNPAKASKQHGKGDDGSGEFGRAVRRCDDQSQCLCFRVPLLQRLRPLDS